MSEPRLREPRRVESVRFGAGLVSPITANADVFIRAGDTAPILTDTILDPSGNQITTLSNVQFVIRSLQSAAPVVLTGTASIVSGAEVEYVWSATDTALAGPGLFNAEWVCTLTNGETYTYPNTGYRTVAIGSNLTNAPQELVSVADAKDYLNIPTSDESQDEKLLRFIRALRPVVENLTGPIIPQQFEEWHEGGQTWVQLNHPPRTDLGSSPLLTVLACSEYRGPVEWNLAIVQNPAQGALYTAMLDIRYGRIVRRAPGGGVMQFAAMGPQSVHVIYEAGQNTVPDNVYEGTLELIRENFQRTQSAMRMAGGVPAGLEHAGGGADEASVPSSFRWGRAYKLLAPSKRHPSIA